MRGSEQALAGSCRRLVGEHEYPEWRACSTYSMLRQTGIPIPDKL